MAPEGGASLRVVIEMVRWQACDFIALDE